MPAGDPCKAPDCEATQPCPYHTFRGVLRKNRRAGDKAFDNNVHELFSDERREAESDFKPPSGKRSYEVDSRDRIRIKQRLGKRWSQVYKEIENGDYTWDEFVETLSAEELARGQLAAEDGTFRGRPPDFIPRQFFLACKREMFDRFNVKIQANLEIATTELIRLSMSPEMEPKDRAKILQYMIERVMGKVPDRLEVAAADPWETIISDILADAPAGSSAPDYLKNRQASSHGTEE